MKKKIIISLAVVLLLVACVYVMRGVVNVKQNEEPNVQKYEVYTADDLQFGDTIKIKESDIYWTYIGKTEEGKLKLISSTHTNDTLTLSGENYLVATDLLNNECERLYSVGGYLARSVNVDDINGVLNYDGIRGEFVDATVNPVKTLKPLSIAEIESRRYGWISYRQVPLGSSKSFKEYLSDFYSYIGSKYASKTTLEYNIVFTKNEYWLASIAAEAYFDKGYVEYIVRSVSGGMVNGSVIYISDGTSMTVTCNLRPVIELEANEEFFKEDDCFVTAIRDSFYNDILKREEKIFKMKIKRKEAISLVVLVITILVLSILATAVILSLSSTNIISEAQNAINKYNNALTDEQTAYQDIVDMSKAKDKNVYVLEGAGTEENPYLIDSIEDLVLFACQLPIT